MDRQYGRHVEGLECELESQSPSTAATDNIQGHSLQHTNYPQHILLTLISYELLLRKSHEERAKITFMLKV